MRDKPQNEVDTNDRELKEKLNAWRVEINVPAGFRREVWARIAAESAGRDWAWWRELVTAVSRRMARPAFAAGVLLLTVSASLAIAHVNASETNARRWAAIESHYVASLDPYSHLARQ